MIDLLLRCQPLDGISYRSESYPSFSFIHLHQSWSSHQQSIDWHHERCWIILSGKRCIPNPIVIVGHLPGIHILEWRASFERGLHVMLWGAHYELVSSGRPEACLCLYSRLGTQNVWTDQPHMARVIGSLPHAHLDACTWLLANEG